MFYPDRNLDTRTVRDVLRGQRDAFATLVERYLLVVQAVAYAHTGNASDADDVAQEAFLRAFKRLDSLREPRKFGAWLLSIVRHVAADIMTAKVREAKGKVLLDTSEPVVLPDMERRELQETVRRQVMQLDPEQREVLLLRYFTGKSIREIAALCGITPNAAKKRIARARDLLGKRMLREVEALQSSQKPSKKDVSRIMGVIGGVPVAWEGAAAATAPSVAAATLALGRVLIMKKAILGATIAIGAIAGLYLLKGTAQDNPERPPALIAESEQERLEPETLPVRADGVLEAESAVTDAVQSVVSTVSQGEVADSRQPVLGSISGVVVDEVGNPLKEARVTAVPENEDGTIETDYEKEGRTKTDAKGAFTLTELPAGTYMLGALPAKYLDTFEPPPNSRRRSQRTSLSPYHKLLRVTLGQGERKRGVKLVFLEGQSVWGRVTDEEGQPISDAQLQLIKLSISTRSDKEGLYSIEGLYEPDRGLSISASADGYLSNPRRWVSPGTQQDFVLKRYSLIEGRVVRADTGDPVSEFRILARVTPEDPRVDSHHIDDFALGPSETVRDPEGRFVLRRLPAGNVTVQVSAPGYAFGRQHVTIEYPGEHVTDVVVRLQRGHVLKGLVTNSTGEPVAGAIVSISHCAPGDVRSRYGLQRVAKSNDEGEFEITGVSPEAQRVYAHHNQYAPGWAGVNLNSSGPTSVRIVLTKGGAIEGMVTLDGVELEVKRSPVSVLFPSREIIAMPFGQQVITDSKSIRIVDVPGARPIWNQGSYRLPHVTPGVVEVRYKVYDESLVSLQYQHFLEASAEVVDGKTTTVDFDLVRSYDATVEGRVLFEGEPFNATIVICLTRPDGVRAWFQDWSDGTGFYRFKNILPGTMTGLVSGQAPNGVWLEREFTFETRSGEVVQHDIHIAR